MQGRTEEEVSDRTLFACCDKYDDVLSVCAGGLQCGMKFLNSCLGQFYGDDDDKLWWWWWWWWYCSQSTKWREWRHAVMVWTLIIPQYSTCQFSLYLAIACTVSKLDVLNIITRTTLTKMSSFRSFRALEASALYVIIQDCENRQQAVLTHALPSSHTHVSMHQVWYSQTFTFRY